MNEDNLSPELKERIRALLSQIAEKEGIPADQVHAAIADAIRAAAENPAAEPVWETAPGTAAPDAEGLPTPEELIVRLTEQFL